MSTNKEDKITLNEVLKICRTVKDENIEINTDPIIRPKNFEFMQKYDLNGADIRLIIRNLQIEDYREGPVEDDNPKFKHPFWIFIKYVNDIKVVVYVKIKIFNHKKKINVFSIHEEGEY